LTVTSDRETHESGHALAHVNVGSAVVDPGAYALGFVVGKLEIDVDHDSSLVERDGNSDRGGCVFGGWFGRRLGVDAYGEDDDDQANSEPHGVIVMP